MTMPGPPPLSDALSSILGAAPTLSQSPGLAVGVAQGAQTPDQAVQLGQAAGQAAQVNAFSDAVTAVKHHSSFFGHVFGAVGSVLHAVEHNPVTGSVGGTVLRYMAKPLQEVQHEYRYMHVMFARHGVVQGLLHLAPVVGVGALTAAFGGGFQGSLLAAEGAGSVEGRLDSLIYHKSSVWNETANGGRYANNLSFGRDAASLLTHLPLGIRPNSEAFSAISGLIDGGADFVGDPIAAGASWAAHTRQVTYALKDPAQLSEAAARNARTPLSAIANRVIPQDSPVWRAVNDMAKETSASALQSRYRGLSDNMAADLARAKNVEGVLKVYQTHAALDDHFSAMALPTLTTTSIGAAKARAAFLNGWRKQVDTPITTDPATGLPSVDLSPDITASWRDRLSAYRAYVVDPERKSIDSRHVDPAHPNFPRVIRDQSLITQSQPVARRLFDAAAQLDVAGRLAIYRQVVKNNVLGMIPDDTELQRHVLDQIDKHLTVGSEGTLSGEYGRDIQGNPLDTVQLPAQPDVRLDADGNPTDAFDRTVKAALYSTQAGKVRIPDYMTLVDAARTQGRVAKFYGPLDSFFYRQLTSKFFKPMALLTPAFANRVGLSEALLNLTREGPAQFFGGLAAQRSATLSRKLVDEDYGIYKALGKVAQFARPWLGTPAESLTAADLNTIAVNVMRAKSDLYEKISKGMGKISYGDSPTWDETAARLAAENGQRLVPDATSSHESASLQTDRDLQAGMEQTLQNMLSRDPHTRTVLSDQYGVFGPGQPNHEGIWAGALNQRSRAPEGRAAATHVQEAFATTSDFATAERLAIQKQAEWLQTPEAVKLLERKQLLLAKGDPIDLATRQVKDTIAKTFSPATRKPNGDLLDRVANGEAFDKSQLKKIPVEDRPLYIEGAGTLPIHDSTYDRLVNAGFDKLVSPIVDNLSRKGIYVTKLDQQYNQLRQFADKWAKTEGGRVLDDGELWDRAKIRAIEDMMPDIHNVYLRSQFSDLSRNFMPFYFAQEQALKRWGRAIVKNPGVIRRLQLIHHAGKATGVVHTDPTTGQESFVYPVSGLANEVLGALAPLGVDGVSGSIPISFSGNMQSLNTVVPGQESFGLRPAGPVVAIPALMLQKFVPDSTPAVQALLQQGAQSGFWQQIVPNSFLRNTVKAFYGENSTSYLNAEMDALKSMKYHGLLPTDEKRWEDPNVRQTALQQVKNWTRIAFLVNAVASATGLAATQVSAGEANFTDQFREQIKKSGDIRQAYVDFQKVHPNATPFTVFNSDSPTGAPLPADQSALNFLNDNPSLFNKLPYAAAWLFPQNQKEPFSIAAYNEQAAFGLREHKGAQRFVNDLYSASADQQFYDNLAKYQAAKAATQDPYQQKLLGASWHLWVSDFGKTHPVWYADFNSPDRLINARNAVQQLGVALGFAPGKDGKTAVRSDSPQVAPMRMLYGQYVNFQQAYASAKAQGAPTQVITTSFRDWLDTVAQAHPELQPVISRVFKTILQDGSG